MVAQRLNKEIPSSIILDQVTAQLANWPTYKLTSQLARY
jgi:hypothetical protein